MISYACSWKQPPLHVNLQQNDVHVWFASLDVSVPHLSQLASTLNTVERERAKRFYLEQDKARFIAGRGLLRAILGYYSDVEAAELQFSYSSLGKPFLAETYRGSSIQFNLSHAHGFVLYAITLDRKIGVDLEYIKHIPEADRIVHRFFSHQEKADFHTFNSDEKPTAFFRYWTCKEAYIKACGQGLTHSLDQIEISLAPKKPATVLSIKGEAQATCHWFLQELQPTDDLAAALVVEGSQPLVTCWHIPHWQEITV